MDMEASRTAKDSLELMFEISKILECGLDRHTLSVLIALCDVGLNPESLAVIVKELQRQDQRHNHSITDSTSSS